MADPKIRYDIEAGVSGEADVNRLAAELEKLDDSLDPALAERARTTAQRIRELGQQQDAIDSFVRIKQATTDAADALNKAQTEAQNLARTIGTTAAPTRAQVRQLDELKTAVRGAKDELERNTAELDKARIGLTALGVPTEGLSRRQSELRTELEATSTELRQIATTADATRGLSKIAQDTEAATAGLEDAQAAVVAFTSKLASAEAPTAAEVAELGRLADAVQRSRTALEQQATALTSQRADLSAAGVATGTLEARQSELAAQLAATATQLQQVGTRSAALQGFAQLVDQTENAREALFLADRALDEYRASLSATNAPTAAQARQLGTLAEAARQAQIAFQAASASQATAAASLRSAGEDVDRLVTSQTRARAETSAMAVAHREAAAAAALQGNAFAAAGASQVQTAATVRQGLEGIAGQLRTLQQLAGAAIGGQLLGGLVGDVARTADAYSNLAARIRLVTGEGQAFDRAFQGVFDIATRTNSSLESTGTLFQRIAQAGKEIKLSNESALALTETINQAVQVSGGSAESADAAVTQLIQGLQSGVLRGEEFNSVMEQAPRLARALADGLGVTTDELRKQADAGRLTSQVVIGALQGQADVVATEFNKLPPTVGRAIQNLSTEWTRYIGEVDQANGISTKAAQAIGLVAQNLDVLGSALIAAGKAWVAFKAFDLAATLMASARASMDAAAAKNIDTAATVANTAAVSANTVAHTANANVQQKKAQAYRAAFSEVASGLGVVETQAAKADAAVARAGATTAGMFGRVASVAARASQIGLIITGVVATFSLLKDGIDAASGALANWLFNRSDVGKAMKESEAEMRAQAEALKESKRWADQHAQAQQQAADKALELSKAARQLVSEFEGMRAKGESVADSLEKVSKNLQLGDLQGIKDASAALDALALKGQISSKQVRDALAEALNGKDLGVFRAQAEAAFDGSAQGARRLAAAVDAVGTESLRRAGTSAQELQTGFSTAMNSAINDTDSLIATIDKLGAKGPEVGRTLSGSLDKTLDAANTERAIQAVIDRWTALGQQGLVTGEQLAAGLGKARAKLDELRPGISSLDEALKAFGLKTRDELQQTAEKYAAAWAQISTSTTTSLADKAKAFAQFKEAAVAANNGIVPSSVALQEEMLKVQLRGTDAGKALADAMDKAGGRVDDLRSRVTGLGEQLNTVSKTAGVIGGSKVADNPDQNTNPFSGAQPDYTLRNDLQAKFNAGTLTSADSEAAAANLAAARANQQAFGKVAGAKGFDEAVQLAVAIVDRVKNSGTGASASKSSSSNSSNSSSGNTTHNVNITLGGKTTTINAASAADASALADFMRQLQAAAGVSQ